MVSLNSHSRPFSSSRKSHSSSSINSLPSTDNYDSSIKSSGGKSIFYSLRKKSAKTLESLQKNQNDSSDDGEYRLPYSNSSSSLHLSPSTTNHVSNSNTFSSMKEAREEPYKQQEKQTTIVDSHSKTRPKSSTSTQESKVDDSDALQSLTEEDSDSISSNISKKNSESPTNMLHKTLSINSLASLPIVPLSLADLHNDKIKAKQTISNSSSSSTPTTISKMPSLSEDKSKSISEVTPSKANLRNTHSNGNKKPIINEDVDNFTKSNVENLQNEYPTSIKMSHSNNNNNNSSRHQQHNDKEFNAKSNPHGKLVGKNGTTDGTTTSSNNTTTYKSNIPISRKSSLSKIRNITKRGSLSASSGKPSAELLSYSSSTPTPKSRVSSSSSHGSLHSIKDDDDKITNISSSSKSPILESIIPEITSTTDKEIDQIESKPTIRGSSSMKKSFSDAYLNKLKYNNSIRDSKALYKRTPSYNMALTSMKRGLSSSRNSIMSNNNDNNNGSMSNLTKDFNQESSNHGSLSSTRSSSRASSSIFNVSNPYGGIELKDLSRPNTSAYKYLFDDNNNIMNNKRDLSNDDDDDEKQQQQQLKQKDDDDNNNIVQGPQDYYSYQTEKSQALIQSAQEFSLLSGISSLKNEVSTPAMNMEVASSEDGLRNQILSFQVSLENLMRVRQECIDLLESFIREEGKTNVYVERQVSMLREEMSGFGVLDNLELRFTKIMAMIEQRQKKLEFINKWVSEQETLFKEKSIRAKKIWKFTFWGVLSVLILFFSIYIYYYKNNNNV